MKYSPIESILIDTGACPKMYATSRESFMNRVSTCLEIADLNFSSSKFWEKHLGVIGSSYVNPNEPMTDEWARFVIDDALEILKHVS